MRKSIRLIAVPATVAMLTLGAAAHAQQQKGLVNVNVSDVNAEIAKDLNVEVSQIPATVQVPVGVAATVCGVDANALAKQKKDGDASCDAKNTSQALNQFVQRQIKAQN